MTLNIKDFDGDILRGIKMIALAEDQTIKTVVERACREWIENRPATLSRDALSMLRETRQKLYETVDPTAMRRAK